MRAGVGLLVLLLGAPATAQTLDERLDEERFLRELGELHLPDVFEHYLETNPAVDDVAETLRLIAAERMTLRTPRLPASEREAALERLLERRAQLVDTHGDDPRRAVWLADQASDLLFELLPIEASGVTCLLGLPSPGQLERAQRAAERMREAAALAEIEIERALLDLESTPGFLERIDLQMRRRRLARDERNRRIPFLLGAASLLWAEVGALDEIGREDHLIIAADLLPPLGDELSGELAARALAWGGLAHLRLGEVGEAAALFDRVEAMPTVHTADRFMARIGRLWCEAGDAESMLGELPALERRYAGADDLFFRILITDQRFELLREIAMSRPADQREAALARAFQAYVDLIDAELPAPRETVRRIVLDRLSRAAGVDTPLDGLPALVSIARAEHEARYGGAASSIALYEATLERHDLEESDRAAALWGLGRALLETGRVLEGADRLVEVARDIPGDPRSESAIEVAVDALATAWRSNRANVDVAERLRVALDLLLQRFPNVRTVETWRYTAGRLALEENRLDDAVSYFRRVTPDAATWIDAQHMLAASARRRATTAARSERTAALESALTECARAQAALMSILDDAGERRVEVISYLTSIAVMLGETQLDLDEPERAIEALDTVDLGGDATPSVVASALRTRILAWQAIGDRDAVAREVRRFLETVPDQAPDVLARLLATAAAEIERDYIDDLGSSSIDAERARLADVAIVLAAWLDEQRTLDATLAPRVADALRLAGSTAEALALYDELLVDSPNALPLLYGRAECLRERGGDELGDAMLIYRRIAMAGRDRTGRYFWPTQLRMLEILDQTGNNTHQIAPRVQQLRREDDAMGGPGLRRRFDALERKHRR